MKNLCLICLLSIFNGMLPLPIADEYRKGGYQSPAYNPNVKKPIYDGCGRELYPGYLEQYAKDYEKLKMQQALLALRNTAFKSSVSTAE